MANFLLIHGSCHGAWCWRDVLPRLNARGHAARAIDLPSHGHDGTPVEEVTLDLYARAIVEALEGPTIVVGHSMAGFPITAAAELAPEKIARLVYLCAYVPRPGKSLVDLRLEAPRQPLMKAVVKSADGKSFTIDPAQAPDVFYHDCPAEAVEYAGQRLCPQAILPQATPLALNRAPSVPRSYIICNDDRTIPPEYQRTMTEDWPAEDVFEMYASHSPFFSQPDKLAEILFQIAERP